MTWNLELRIKNLENRIYSKQIRSRLEKKLI